MLFRAAIVALGLLLLAVGCAGSGADSRTPAGPASGAKLYQKGCSGCHEAYPPHAYNDAQWPAVIDRMRKQSGLTDKELEIVLQWLLANN